MENKINIAELLKDCPKGMELYSPLFGDCKFVKVHDYEAEIIVELETGATVSFLTDGRYYDYPNAECILFPKGRTTWEGFQRPFEDGDVVTYKYENGLVSMILNKFVNFVEVHYYCALYNNAKGFITNNYIVGEPKYTRFATEEEKQKLFQAIKDNGYKWNAETKTLEKLTIPHTPKKFYIRIGDIPSEEKSAVYRGETVVGYENGVSVYDCIEADGLYHIIMPFPLKEGQGITYENLIQEIAQCRYEIENPRKVYLVSGMEIGKGHDNEPLIKDVKILKDLTGQFNTKNDNTEETKTLEKLVEPKFKVGDKIKYKNGKNIDGVEQGVILSITDDTYDVAVTNDMGIFVSIADQDDWELVLDIKPKFKVGDRIKGKSGKIVYRVVQITGDLYILDNLCSIPISMEHMYDLVPNKFDITTLKPFKSEVLVRDTNTDKWRGAFYSYYNSKKFYTIGSSHYYQCIPYKGNEYLLGTTDDCDEYFKIW